MHTTMATENNNKNLNVPNLRFPEFSGEWDRIKVSDLLELYPTNSLSWEQLEYSQEGVFNLHYGLIHKGLPTQVDVFENNLPIIKEEFIPKKMSLCLNGDVAFADASEDTNDVAKCIEFANCEGKKIVCGLHTIHGRDTQNKTVTGYKGFAFSARAFREQIRRLAQGTKIYSINSGNFSECYIGIPSKAEQRKIANLLLAVDQRIATQIKIIEKLESLIRGISNSLLYADNGTSVRIGDILTERVEKTKINNQHEVLSSTVKGIFSQREYFSKDIASENNIGYKVIRLHDVVLSPQNLWMGNINYNDSFEVGIVSPSYKIFTIADGYDKTFIASMLKTHRALYNYMLVSEQGASVVRRNLNMEAFEQLVFKIPPYGKQCEIGRTMSTLQNRLAIANSTKTAYEQQKQWLLKQLFI